MRIGVLDEQSNPSPITFTDYVQVQAGDGQLDPGEPARQRRRPDGGALALTDVRPDAAGHPRRRQRRTPSTRGCGRGSTRVGERHGRDRRAGPSRARCRSSTTSSRSSGNTGRGLIVVKVVRESVPDYPVVADTVLTAETREDFPRGVDVVAGKVTWSGGDVDDLTLALWGEPHGRRASTGAKLSGALPDAGPHHPVRRDRRGPVGRGHDATRFLRVPGDDDLALALRAGAAAAGGHGARVGHVRHGASSWRSRAGAARGRRRRARLRRAHRRGVRRRVAAPRALRRGRGRAVDGRLPVPVRLDGPGRVDLPLRADRGARRSTRSPSCARDR